MGGVPSGGDASRTHTAVTLGAGNCSAPGAAGAGASRRPSAWERRHAEAPRRTRSRGWVAPPPWPTTTPPTRPTGGPRPPHQDVPPGFGRVTKDIEHVPFPVGDQDNPGRRGHVGRGRVHQVHPPTTFFVSNRAVFMGAVAVFRFGGPPPGPPAQHAQGTPLGTDGQARVQETARQPGLADGDPRVCAGATPLSLGDAGGCLFHMWEFRRALGPIL
jgi:hypothetical protein